ncbi:MAG: hypothetical protein HOM03_05320 [Marinovum sp.]|jgi:hypothetical protein|nr:hypothetical protein [Marinovum sp.]MBT4873003.1 hypothetical protein [Marinovum sp.]MBT6099339.1 hypothetical protein [Marinovum sp.]MBT6506907.1 hypothetical protein [Marinovum sp.]MBT6532379.1 hypothetical protein [Marinovum sp.]|tara:strand:- start:188 stop:526 length:339 start_codon:yes stop_codon:yes gene_type:complete
MARKTFMAIHTYKSDLAKKNAFESLKNTVRTDYEWVERWDFPKAQCIATWVGTDDFFFCHWEAETEEDIMTTLSENGMDENLITVAYPIFMHINKNDCSGLDPYKVWAEVDV